MVSFQVYERVEISLVRVYERGRKLAISRAVNPPRLQILRIDGEGMINDVITHTARDVFVRREIDVVGIGTFDLISVLPTNHIIAYITMAYQSL